MSFSFNPLWKMLIDKNMTREDLRKELNLSPSTMAKMSKGEFVSLEVIHRICAALDSQPGGLLEYIPNENKRVLEDVHHDEKKL
ncbi:MAG TPA: helix-turn-helix transcriptional regulator [Desulfosporosinus sp.]|nr:helix-turn-helix transcriptional regulator [Desulfosporosinus sp.]